MERNIIDEIMTDKKLSLHQIAKLINFDVSVVSRVRTRSQKMSYRMAYKISEVFGLDLKEIIEVEGV
jgi:transcriptional regulator with XRE-family HTH domain